MCPYCFLVTYSFLPQINPTQIQINLCQIQINLTMSNSN